MKVCFYKYPESVEWRGWVENCKGQVVGFIKLDGAIVWEW